jgi:hypothetical protein
MRNLLLAGIMLLCHLCHAQLDPPKRTIGTFIYKNSAYNYELKSSSGDNYSLRITSVTATASKKSIDKDRTSVSEARKKDEEKRVSATEKASINNESTQDSLKADPQKPTAKNESKTGLDPKANAATTSEAKPEEEEEAAYLFSELTNSILQQAIVDQLHLNFGIAEDDELDDFAIAQAIRIKSNFEFLDDEPVTANLILKDDYVSSLLTYNNSPYYTGSLSRLVAGHRVESVRIETEDGAIKNIIAHFVAPSVKTENVSPRAYVEFKNTFPISISGKFDPEAFSKIRLYCLNCWGIQGLDRFIKLSELLELDIVLENGKEDYSPVNTTVELTPSHPIAELKKEKRSRILEVAAFTDFVGLDQEEPNGLIQFEARRRININTKSFPFRHFETADEITNQMDISDMKEVARTRTKDSTIFTYRRSIEKDEILPNSSKNIKVRTKWITVTDKKNGNRDSTQVVDFIFSIKKKNFNSIYGTVFNNIEPRLLFSKIDQNQRFIDSLALDGNKIDPVTLMKYQLVSFGLTANLFRISYPQLKFSWNLLSVGGYWFRSRVGFSSDSTRTSIPLNNSYLLFSSELVFKPDSRWGLTMGINCIKPTIWHNDYELTSNSPILQPYFDGFLKTNGKDKLFFRFRWSYQHKARENNFTQIQVGYNVNLFTGSTQQKQEISNR